MITPCTFAKLYTNYDIEINTISLKWQFTNYSMLTYLHKSPKPLYIIIWSIEIISPTLNLWINTVCFKITTHL